MARKAIVDPAFPDKLRELRTERSMSYRDLGAATAYSHTLLWEIEKGRKQPSPDLAHRIDEVLCTGGVLGRLVTVPVALDPVTPEDEERLAYAARHPRSVDDGALRALSTLLAEQRHREDEMGSDLLIAPATKQLALMAKLLREASGRQRQAVVNIAAQWAQFAGWLNTSSRRPVIAEAWFDRAVGWAVEANNPDLTSTVLSFKGHLAWLQGNIGPMIALTEAAQRIDGVYLGERAYDALQAARGHAIAGDRGAVESAVALSADLEAGAAEYAGPIPAWHYYRTPQFFALERGRVFRHMAGVDGYGRRAVEELTAGLGALDTGQGYAAPYLCDLAVAYALDGDAAAANRVLDEVSEIASTLGSKRLATVVGRMRRQVG